MQDKKLNVLIFGIGSLSSSIIEKLNQSSNIGNVFTISSGQNHLLKRINIGSGKEIRNIDCKNIIREKNIDFAIMFGEAYAYSGLNDYYRKIIPVIGVTQKWFLLESSKIFGKNFMIENGIKTPDFQIIKSEKDIKTAIKNFGLPIVIKNDNLKAGFGTFICEDFRSCRKIINQILKKEKLPCIAEKFIKGEEITQTYLWDTNNLIALNPVRDYKKLKEGNKGINTGSLGCYTPVELTQKQQEILNKYNKQMEIIFETVKPDFTGIFCTNILFSEDNIYTLEFNMRPGIPEFQTLLENMDIDILDFFYKIAKKEAKDIEIKYKHVKSGCVVIVHKDYYKQVQNKFKTISLKNFYSIKQKEVKIYLNSDYIDYDYKTNHPTDKVLCNLINTDKNPFKNIYRYLKEINTKDLYYRKDIGD